MADLKLSQLTTGAAIVDTDIFYSGKDAGGGLFNQVKQSGLALRNFVGGGINRQVPLTGNTVAMANSDGHLILDPAGALATLTVQLPVVPTIEVDIRSSQAISTFTLNPGVASGWTVTGAPSTLAAGRVVRAIPNSGNTTWYVG